MIYCLEGRIKFALVDSVVLSVGGIGYEVLVSHPEQFLENTNTLLYIHDVVKEDEHYLVGFPSLEEKKIFNLLLKVKGLGPKSVINALRGTSPNEITNAIASNNLAYLKRLPGIGAKAAGQILLDLDGEITGKKGDPHMYEEVHSALKELGFKGTQIDRVLETINEPNATSEEILKIALAKLRK